VTDTQLAPSQAARDHVATWPHLEALRARLEPIQIDRSKAGADVRALLDLDALSAELGAPATIEWAFASPDRSHVAIGVSPGGNEQSTLYLVEMASARHVATITNAARATVAWLPDSSGFYLNVTDGPEQESFARRIVLHSVAEATTSAPLELDVGGHDWIAPQTSPEHAAVVVYEGNFLPRPWYVRRHDDPAGTWRPFLRDVGATVRGFFLGERYVAVTELGASRRRLVSIPLDAGEDPSTWTDLLPESDRVLMDVFPAGRDLLVAAVDDARPVALLVSPEGEVRAVIEPPAPGALEVGVQWPTIRPRSTTHGPDAPPADEVAFVFHSPACAPTPYVFDVAAGTSQRRGEPVVELPDVTCERRWVTSSDGTRIPYEVFARAGIEGDGPQPVLVYGYGGFNVPWFASFAPGHVPFLEAGGIYVVPHLRGGGEFGEGWWRGGHREHKQQGFDDLFAVLQDLVERGVTVAQRIAVIGGSNGGLLVGAALTQRPELFGAAVAIVPAMDVIRATEDAWTRHRTVFEYGDPDIVDEREWLLAYSPVHNVRERAYPPTLVIAAENDTRTPTWHAESFVARLQEAQQGDAPVLLYIQPGSGHASGEGLDQQVVRMAFLMRHLGLAPVTSTEPSSDGG